MKQTIPLDFAELISDNFLLRGKFASIAMRQHLSKMSTQAEQDGLSEAEIANMLNDD